MTYVSWKEERLRLDDLRCHGIGWRPKGLTQEEFATEFGLDLSTLRNWEQGRSEPDTATRTLLRTIAAHPAAVHEALKRQD